MKLHSNRSSSSAAPALNLKDCFQRLVDGFLKDVQHLSSPKTLALIAATQEKIQLAVGLHRTDGQHSPDGQYSSEGQLSVNGAGRIVITFDERLEGKARHLWEEWVGRFKADRPSIPSLLIEAKHQPWHSKDSDVWLHFGSEAALQPHLERTLTPSASPTARQNILAIDLLGDSPEESLICEEQAIPRIGVRTLAGISLVLHLLCEATEPTPASCTEELQKIPAIISETFDHTEFNQGTLRLQDFIDQRLNSGGALFLGGNGGSACDLWDLGGELPAFLLTESGYLTCVANDYGYDEVFARPVSWMNSSQDTLLAVSSSGNSANIVTAFKRCRESGVPTILFGGKGGGQAHPLATISLLVRSSQTERVQEIHSIMLEGLGNWLRSRPTNE